MIRLLVVDDQALVRNALVSKLNGFTAARNGTPFGGRSSVSESSARASRCSASARTRSTSVSVDPFNIEE